MITKNCILPEGGNIAKAPTFLDCVWGIAIGDYASLATALGKNEQETKPGLAEMMIPEKPSKRKRMFGAVKTVT